MENFLAFRQSTSRQMLEELRQIYPHEQGWDKSNVEQKKDKSMVTAIDIALSNLVKREVLKHPVWKDYAFYSEEDHGELKFPAVILDPIDGTRELVKGLGECALSLGVFASPRLDDPKNWGWICNPFSGFSIDSSDPMFAIKIKEEGPVSGLVSRSEWNKGLYKNLQRDDLQIYPRGSIAFKLGLLASNACDFIISLAPKNIWDIAGGTLLAHSRGFKLYAGGVEVVELSQATYQPPLLWCRPQHFSQLKEALRI